jgi:hypothetical protein
VRFPFLGTCGTSRGGSAFAGAATSSGGAASGGATTAASAGAATSAGAGGGVGCAGGGVGCAAGCGCAGGFASPGTDRRIGCDDQGDHEGHGCGPITAATRSNGPADGRTSMTPLAAIVDSFR